MEALIVFLLTPWIFITLISVAVILNLILIEEERFGWNSFIVAILLVLLNFKYDLISYIKENPLDILWWFLGYFVVGLLWSFGKWEFKLSSITRKIRNAIKNNKEKIESGSEKIKEEGFEGLERDLSKAKLGGFYLSIDRKNWRQKIVTDLLPQAKNNKSLITAWIGYWPFSLVSTLLNDPIRRFVNWLYYKFSKIYELIENKKKKSIMEI